MANKAKKDNKNVIIGACAAIIVVVAIVVTILMLGGANKINDNYFVSDGSKYVLTMDASEMSFDESEAAYAPLKTHMVYTYDGDKITGLKTYAEYKDNAAAKAALEAMKAAGEEVKGVTIDGKYLVETMSEEDYEGMTASDVKQQIEFMEMLKKMNFDEADSTEEIVEEVDEVEPTE